MFEFFNIQLGSNVNTSVNSIKSYVVGFMEKRDLRAQTGGPVEAGGKLMCRGAESASRNCRAEAGLAAKPAWVPPMTPASARCPLFSPLAGEVLFSSAVLIHPTEVVPTHAMAHVSCFL